MLHLWVEKDKEGATGNALERALNTIGRQDIIQRCIYTMKEVTDVTERQVALEHLERGRSQLNRSILLKCPCYVLLCPDNLRIDQLKAVMCV